MALPVPVQRLTGGAVVHRWAAVALQPPARRGTIAGMGIRYSAVSFDAALSDKARQWPYRVYHNDPFEGSKDVGCSDRCDHSKREWSDPCRGYLGLDKAWRTLQRLTEPTWPDPARPAYRMFEGDATFVNEWPWEIPWVRAVLPEEVPAIRDDLLTLGIDDFDPAFRWRHNSDGTVVDDFDYEAMFLEHAKTFLAWLAEDGRGMVYLIG